MRDVLLFIVRAKTFHGVLIHNRIYSYELSVLGLEGGGCLCCLKGYTFCQFYSFLVTYSFWLGLFWRSGILSIYFHAELVIGGFQGFLLLDFMLYYLCLVSFKVLSLTKLCPNASGTWYFSFDHLFAILFVLEF